MYHYRYTKNLCRKKNREACISPLAEDNVGIKFVDCYNRSEYSPECFEEIEKVEYREVSSELAGAHLLVSNSMLKKRPLVIRRRRHENELGSQKPLLLNKQIELLYDRYNRIKVSACSAARKENSHDLLTFWVVEIERIIPTSTRVMKRDVPP